MSDHGVVAARRRMDLAAVQFTYMLVLAYGFAFLANRSVSSLA